MATKKSASKKKTASPKKAVPTKKPTSPKKAAVKKQAVPLKKATTKKAVLRGTAPLALAAIGMALCGPGRRCKQRVNGGFIRQNFINGRWVQVGGTIFPTMEACKKACAG